VLGSFDECSSQDAAASVRHLGRSSLQGLADVLTVSRTRRVDWPRLVENLMRLGMTTQQIADSIDVARRSLDNWARQDSEGEPAFWTGSALIVLWCQRTGLQWTDVPVRKVTPSVSEVLRTS
jgi:hypothetical protein